MTRAELLADIDRATSALASRAAQQNTGTGIPRPPTIEVSESSLETQPFNFELNATSNAQAGAGGGGPGGGGTPSTGACCYDDGTCDDITNGDCVAAEGTFQGNGTHCSDTGVCLGVCCEPECVDSSTPDSCALDGGTFLGFGTACDDIPAPCVPTGACCHLDGSCSVIPAGDCDGTYQGDDSTCADRCGGIGACCEGGLLCEIESAMACAGDGGVFLGNDTNCDNICTCLEVTDGYVACGSGCCAAGQLCCTCEGGAPPEVCCDPGSFICGDCGIGGATCQPI